MASDIVLLGEDIAPIASAVTTARSAVTRIKENFTIATVYNFVAVPIAIAGWATPLVGRAGDVGLLDHRFAQFAEVEIEAMEVALSS